MHRRRGPTAWADTPTHVLQHLNVSMEHRHIKLLLAHWDDVVLTVKEANDLDIVIRRARKLGRPNVAAEDLRREMSDFRGPFGGDRRVDVALACILHAAYQMSDSGKRMWTYRRSERHANYLREIDASGGPLSVGSLLPLWPSRDVPTLVAAILKLTKRRSGHWESLREAVKLAAHRLRTARTAPEPQIHTYHAHATLRPALTQLSVEEWPEETFEIPTLCRRQLTIVGEATTTMQAMVNCVACLVIISE